MCVIYMRMDLLTLSPCAWVNLISSLLLQPLLLKNSLTSFTIPGTGAPMPRYRKVTPSVLLLAHASMRSIHFVYCPSYLFYRTWHRDTDVSTPVCHTFPLHSVLCFAEETREGETSCLCLIKPFFSGLFWSHTHTSIVRPVKVQRFVA